MVCEGPVSSFEHEFSAVLVTDPAPAALTGLMPTDAVPSAHFLFLFKYISDCSCPMAFFPLIDVTPAEASRGPSWPCARQSPGCLSILTSSPRLTELKDFVPVRCHHTSVKIWEGARWCPPASLWGQFLPVTRAWAGTEKQEPRDRRVRSYLDCS